VTCFKHVATEVFFVGIREFWGASKEHVGGAWLRYNDSCYRKTIALFVKFSSAQTKNTFGGQLPQDPRVMRA